MTCPRNRSNYNRESLNFEVGVAAHRRDNPMLGGTDNGFLGRATVGW